MAERFSDELIRFPGIQCVGWAPPTEPGKVGGAHPTKNNTGNCITRPGGSDDGADRGRWTSIERALTGLVLAATAVLVALWLPNYLRWPLYWDTEHFAQMAREWDAGLARPYKEFLSYNWPGQLYLCWAGGKLFGWGKSSAVNAMDVLLLAGFSVCILAWSRRCFGRVLPGSVALLGLVTFYLNCSFLLAGQRTWQAALLAAASVMVAQAARNGFGLAASGALLSAAMIFRPDMAVWGAGAVGAVVLQARSIRGAIRPLATWASGAAAGLLLAFAPLLAAGIFGDFLRAFGAGSKGKFYDPDDVHAQSIVASLRDLPHYECLRPYDMRLFLVVIPALWALAFWRGSTAARAYLAAWVATAAVVAVGAFAMPYFIGYLVLPVLVALYLSTAPALAALGGEFRKSPALGLTLTVLLGLLFVPGLPAYCTPGLAWETARAVVTRTHVESAPVFHREGYPEGDLRQRWADYRECLAYLRDGLPKGTTVVNALDPFGDYAGLTFVYSSKRRSGAETTALIVPSFPTTLFDRMIRKTADDPRTAVVVASGQIAAHPPGAPTPPRKIDRWQATLVQTLRERYQPARRFGGLEVWVHTPERASGRPETTFSR